MYGEREREFLRKLEKLPQKNRDAVLTMLGFFIDGMAAQERLAAVRVSANVLTGFTCSEVLSASAYGQKNIPAALVTLEMLSARVHGWKDMPSAAGFADAMTVYAFGSKDMQ